MARDASLLDENALAMKDSRVVHRDVHGSEKRERLGTGGARSFDRLQIRLDGDATATFANDGLPRRFQALLISAHDGDVGSCIRENGRDFCSDSF